MKKKQWFWWAIAAVLTAAAFLSPIGPFLVQRLGPFHVLVLHLPIGILAIASLMAMREWLGKGNSWQEQIKFTLMWAAISGIAAAALGWMLYLSGGYSGTALLLHQWLGTATAVALVAQWRMYPRFDRLWFGISLPVLLATGHFGGTLTHGEDFLTDPPALGQAQKTSRLEEAVVFADLIDPILEEKCRSCHSSSKQKGGLELVDSSSIHAGGENGRVLVAGSAENSTLVQLVESSVHEERHMPPKGRAQLTSSEVNLVKWWIDAGAPFSKKVNDIPQSSMVKELLEKHFANASPLLALGIPFADPEDLSLLKAQGIRIEQLAPGQPFLRLNLSDRQDLSAELFAQVSELEEQVIMLDLGGSNLNDDLLEEIEMFPHLQSLRLDQTAIAEAGLQSLAQFEFLEDLDLSRTGVSCEAFKLLEGLEYLKNINVWQSKCPQESLAELEKSHPQWKIEYGQLATDFADSKLFPPSLDTAAHLFLDSFPLVLESPYPGAEIRYTLDGADVNEQAKLYEPGAFVSQTATLKARCMKDSWESSDLLVHQFVRIGKTPLKSLQKSTPDERYPGTGPLTLLDFKLGDEAFGNPAWTGYFGEDFKGTFALQNPSSIGRVIVHCLEDVRSWIFPPLKIQVWVGMARQGMDLVAELEPGKPLQTREAEHFFFTLDFDPVEARFLKIEVTNFGGLPEWHESAGNPTWLFVDEVLVD